MLHTRCCNQALHTRRCNQALHTRCCIPGAAFWQPLVYGMSIHRRRGAAPVMLRIPAGRHIDSSIVCVLRDIMGFLPLIPPFPALWPKSKGFLPLFSLFPTLRPKSKGFFPLISPFPTLSPKSKGFLPLISPQRLTSADAIPPTFIYCHCF